MPWPFRDRFFEFGKVVETGVKPGEVLTVVVSVLVVTVVVMVVDAMFVTAGAVMVVVSVSVSVSVAVCWRSSQKRSCIDLTAPEHTVD